MEGILKFLVCLICDSHYSAANRPLCYSCTHTFCENCISQSEKHGVNQCPLCKDKSAPIINYSILDVVRYFEDNDLKCENPNCAMGKNSTIPLHPTLLKTCTSCGQKTYCATCILAEHINHKFVDQEITERIKAKIQRCGASAFVEREEVMMHMTNQAKAELIEARASISKLIHKVDKVENQQIETIIGNKTFYARKVAKIVKQFNRAAPEEFANIEKRLDALLVQREDVGTKIHHGIAIAKKCFKQASAIASALKFTEYTLLKLQDM